MSQATAAAATGRLRKAFHYPGDDDEEAPAQDMDEEEQENLITTLTSRDNTQTRLYTQIFLALPLLTAISYLPSFFTLLGFLPSLLSISSLVLTAYILYFLPLPSRSASRVAPPTRSLNNHTYQINDPFPTHGMLHDAAPWLNAGLAIMVLLTGLRDWKKGWVGQEEALLWGGLPLVELGLIMVVRSELRPVGVEDLKGARYGYKGA